MLGMALFFSQTAKRFRFPGAYVLTSAIVILAILLASFAVAQSSDSPETELPKASSQLRSQFDQLKKLMTGATLSGSFTQTAQDGKQPAAVDEVTLRRENYEIRSVKKLPKKDYWIIQTRIQYDDRDLTVPVPVRICWAGTTPVITLDKVAIPGLGKFDARVLIHDGKYAGTWRHDDVGGHLFGDILPAKSAAKR